MYGVIQNTGSSLAIATSNEQNDYNGNQKITPGGGSVRDYRRFAMVSLRAGSSPFFLCRRASRSGPSATL